MLGRFLPRLQPTAQLPCPPSVQRLLHGGCPAAPVPTLHQLSCLTAHPALPPPPRLDTIMNLLPGRAKAASAEPNDEAIRRTHDYLRCACWWPGWQHADGRLAFRLHWWPGWQHANGRQALPFHLHWCMSLTCFCYRLPAHPAGRRPKASRSSRRTTARRCGPCWTSAGRRCWAPSRCCLRSTTTSTLWGCAWRASSGELGGSKRGHWREVGQVWCNGLRSRGLVAPALGHRGTIVCACPPHADASHCAAACG